MTMSSLPKIACLLLCVFGCHGFEETQLYGVSHVAITVADIAKATEFYTGIGGMKIDKLSTDGLFGDGLYYSMFQKQILAAEAAGEDVADYAVCDIKEDGTQEVAWDFVLFDTFLFQLIQCQMRGTDTVVTFKRQNYFASSAAGTYGHMALWVDSKDDYSEFSQDFLEMQIASSSPYAGFQTAGPPPETEAERLQVCQDDLTGKCITPFGPGTDLLATRGRDGEKIELSCRNQEAGAAVLTGWCKDGAIHMEMLPKADRKHTILGMHHVSQTVDNRTEAKVFYQDVIGAKYAMGFPYDSGVYNLVYQDDIFEAKSLGIEDTTEEYAKAGILKDWGNGVEAFVDFYLLDNMFIETYAFSGTTDEGVAAVNTAKPTAQNLSPGYHRSFVTGLWVYEDQDLDAYSGSLEMRATLNAMSEVKTNRANGADPSNPDNKPNSASITEGDMAGFNFVYFNSPSGDTFALVQFKDKAAEALRDAMVAYGAISKAFDEVNPQKSGQVNAFCCGRNVTKTMDGSDYNCGNPEENTTLGPTGGAAMVSGQLGLVLAGLIALFVKMF